MKKINTKLNKILVSAFYNGSFTAKLIKGNRITADLLIKNGIKVKTED